MSKRKFELPYNFDPDYVDELSKRKNMFDQIEFVYLPSWREDGDNARAEIQFLKCYPKTYDEYLTHIRRLQDTGVDVCVLIQRDASIDIISKYYREGIRFFVINDDGLAVEVKEKYSDVCLLLSITRHLTLVDLLKNDYSMYDRIVLFFWFNRHLSYLNRLPAKYRYVIICNTRCYWNCERCDQHWFYKQETNAESHVGQSDYFVYCDNNVKELRDTAFIQPNDITYFDKYVTNYKLVDRTSTTEFIMREFENYSNVDDSIKPTNGKNYYSIGAVI